MSSQKTTTSLSQLDIDNLKNASFVLNTSVQLMKMRYEKYLDSVAKEQLSRIERSSAKIISELEKLSNK